MKVQRIKGSEKIAATKGQVALSCGPLVYCAESVDQDLDKVLGADSALQTEWKGDLLGGVKVIKGTWADGSPLTAIPYYARDNRVPPKPERRGTFRSTVWLKAQ
jgi:hypothetical protein